MAREMKDSGVQWVGTIPKSWKTIKFKYLHDGLNTGEAIDKNFWSAEENDKVFYTAGVFPIRTNYENFPAWKLTTENDLLLARNGTPYVYSPKAGACYTDHIIRAIMKKGINKRYVQYSLQQSIASVVIDTVSIATWSASLWNEQSIAWPSNEEQSAIATYLDIKCAEIDSVLEKTRSSIEEYKKLKQAIITQAVTKGVRGDRPMKESGIDWMGSYPADWTIIKIKWLLEEGKDRSTEGMEEPLSMSQKYGILPTKEMDIVPNIASTFVGAKLVHKGDLVFNKLKAHLGVFAVSGYDGLVSPDYAVYRTTNLANAAFLEYLFKTPQYISEFKKESTGIAAGLTRLYTDELYSIFCALPPLAEQQEIIRYLQGRIATMDALIQKKEQLVTELETYKKSLIYEYVTGKREVI